jgi:uncharacterized lipoprotein YddW (UPF0748 family)
MAWRLFFVLSFLSAALEQSQGGSYLPSREVPPAIAREFRGVWISSVFNINWPSKPGLSASQQQSELVAMLNSAASLNMNAVILQVRPACDALYASNLEPWASWLTGTMGKSPGYDPLEFAVEQAHMRGLELHAWFNPFRALASASTTASSSHVTKKKPQWVRKMNGKVWLDPGLPEVRAYSLGVIMDVVRRYDIDGVHIDDYFYPYPEDTNKGSNFPDSATYRASGSKLGLADWRRANIDTFVSSLYHSIKSKKSYVKFGISPFGIWKPGTPNGTSADLSAYDHLFADSRRWLMNGWCDYLSPQLYWPIAGDQGFGKLLAWWDSQNKAGRHIWPGLAADRIGSARPATEHGRQIALTRTRGRRSAGAVHWNIKSLMANSRGVSSLLEKSFYTSKAIVPELSWIGGAAPGLPGLITRSDGRYFYADWNSNSTARFWVVQVKVDGKWREPTVSAGYRKGLRWAVGKDRLPDVIAVRAVDRAGKMSVPTVLQRQ